MQFRPINFAQASPLPLQPLEDQAMQLSEVLGAFSYALDITEGQPEGHCLRVTWIGCRIAQQLGLTGDRLADIYYTLLLKDLGCSSNAARVCQLYMADDLAVKHDFKTVGTSLRDVLGFVLSRTGATRPFRERWGAILNILKNGGSLVHELIETRCTRGADIARQLRFSQGVADGIYHLDEHWDGSGHPEHLKRDTIPLGARIALLAQIVDVFHQIGGPEAAVAEVTRRSGRWLDPNLVATFRFLADHTALWAEISGPDIEQRVLALPPAQESVQVDEDFMDDIAAAFGQVVDAKSPYTGGHSERVAGYAMAVAEQIGYPQELRRWLRRGALLHDIGKLGVSNSILDKPGPLDDDEWISMRDHAVHTQAILGRLSAFHDLAPIAAAHHEKLDGTGYPRNLSARDIGIETRIITIADFYDALTADRPYRGAMPAEKALSIIGSEVGKAIDPACYAALRAVCGV